MSIDDLEKECRYCCREIDASGLEAFRCTNRAVIKTTDSSWCRPKNANEPCSICEYCEPKQDMRMTIDKAISHLYTYSTTMGSGQTTDAQHEEAKRVAIETMRKYEKIQEIMDELNGDFYGSYLKDRQTLEKIYEVLEDGKED